MLHSYHFVFTNHIFRHERDNQIPGHVLVRGCTFDPPPGMRDAGGDEGQASKADRCGDLQPVADRCEAGHIGHHVQQKD